MKFLCDVHIAFKLVTYFKSLGFEAVHVNEILDKSETKDSDICKYADQGDFIVVTKDADFRDSYFIKRTPKKLIKINLGNIPNQDLIVIFAENINAIQKLNSMPNFLVEIGKDKINHIEMG
jgi:predicted nuclease of predicted toxin-antitoxin system